MPRFIDPETTCELLWGFETALQQLEAERFKEQIFKE